MAGGTATGRIHRQGQADQGASGSRNPTTGSPQSLVDKRTIGAAGARRNLYRPFGADLAEGELCGYQCVQKTLRSPGVSNPSNDGLVGKNSTPISPHQSSAEGAESAEV